MHELGIARSIVDIAVQAARDDGARSVARIGVRIGAMAGVEASALDFAFDAARLGTTAADAVLEVESVPLVCHCRDCDLDFPVDNRYGVALCPACDLPSGDIRQGTELQVSYVEVF